MPPKPVANELLSRSGTAVPQVDCSMPQVDCSSPPSASKFLQGAAAFAGSKPVSLGAAHLASTLAAEPSPWAPTVNGELRPVPAPVIEVQATTSVEQAGVSAAFADGFRPMPNAFGPPVRQPVPPGSIGQPKAAFGGAPTGAIGQVSDGSRATTQENPPLDLLDPQRSTYGLSLPDTNAFTTSLSAPKPVAPAASADAMQSAMGQLAGKPFSPEAPVSPVPAVETSAPFAKYEVPALAASSTQPARMMNYTVPSGAEPRTDNQHNQPAALRWRSSSATRQPEEGGIAGSVGGSTSASSFASRPGFQPPWNASRSAGLPSNALGDHLQQQQQQGPRSSRPDLNLPFASSTNFTDQQAPIGGSSSTAPPSLQAPYGGSSSTAPPNSQSPWNRPAVRFPSAGPPGGPRELDNLQQPPYGGSSSLPSYGGASSLTSASYACPRGRQDGGLPFSAQPNASMDQQSSPCGGSTSMPSANYAAPRGRSGAQQGALSDQQQAPYGGSTSMPSASYQAPWQSRAGPNVQQPGVPPFGGNLGGFPSQASPPSMPYVVPQSLMRGRSRSNSQDMPPTEVGRAASSSLTRTPFPGAQQQPPFMPPQPASPYQTQMTSQMRYR